MSCKSNIYAVNTTSAAVVANGTLPLSTIVRRYNGDSRCCGINLSGNSVSLSEAGYYLVNISATFTAPTAGVVTLVLQDDGVAVAGATASTTITTATTEVRTLNLTAIVRVFCGSAPDALTIVNTGVAATFSNIAIDVVKVA